MPSFEYKSLAADHSFDKKVLLGLAIRQNDEQRQ